MSALHAFLLSICERRRADRRVPTYFANMAQVERNLHEAKYTGITITHWADGLPKRIEFPNPVGIEVSR